MNSRFSKILLAATTVAFLLPSSVFAEGIAHRRVTYRNARGGVTTARGTAAVGLNGGRAVHGRAVSTDAAGDVKSVRGSAFSGPNGARGARGASNTLNANGSATHKSGF
ncbi:MAG TPA: hypothetical protein VMH85_05120, partial [Terriglobales bacterium]|nr:hypothetical protein [Terriglobales bacterium]